MISRNSSCPAVLLLSLVAMFPLAAQERSTLHVGSGNFIVARYSTGGSSSLYAGYSLGPAGLFVAAVINPHSGYRELIGGVVTTLSWASQAVTVAVATADATDGQYIETYLVPNLVAGPLQVSGTFEFYLPLESSGVRQIDINPVTISLPVAGNLRLGAAYATGLAEHTEPTRRAGPVVVLGIPHGTFYVEWLHNLDVSHREVRFGSQLGF
jgi:hypothetical protein